MKVGNDLLMFGCLDQCVVLLVVVESGEFDEKILDCNVECILCIVLQLLVYQGYSYFNKFDFEVYVVIV